MKQKNKNCRRFYNSGRIVKNIEIVVYKVLKLKEE